MPGMSKNAASASTAPKLCTAFLVHIVADLYNYVFTLLKKMENKCGFVLYTDMSRSGREKCAGASPCFNRSAAIIGSRHAILLAVESRDIHNLHCAIFGVVCRRSRAAL